jgi:hypothetical protein
MSRAEEAAGRNLLATAEAREVRVRVQAFGRGREE